MNVTEGKDYEENRAIRTEPVGNERPHFDGRLQPGRRRHLGGAGGAQLPILHIYLQWNW